MKTAYHQLTCNFYPIIALFLCLGLTACQSSSSKNSLLCVTEKGVGLCYELGDSKYHSMNDIPRHAWKEINEVQMPYPTSIDRVDYNQTITDRMLQLFPSDKNIQFSTQAPTLQF